MKQLVFQRILDSFDVDFSDPCIVEYVENHIQKYFREYRADLHAFYKSLLDNVDKTLHPRDDVSHTDWVMLCAIWEGDEKFQARSTVNMESRQCGEILHRGGSRSYARGLIENERMVEINTLPIEGDFAPKANEEIRASVLGVRFGYALGLGYGVVPPRHVPRVTAATTATARVEMEELRTRAENLENELKQLREQQSVQQ